MNNFMRLSLVCVISISFVGSLYAHYPHDTHDFIELSPNYVNDHTAFIASKQASSTNPVSVLVSRDGGASWDFNAKGMDNFGKITSATVSPLYDTDKTAILTSEGHGVYRTVDAGLSWEKFNTGLTTKSLHSSSAALDEQGEVSYFVSAAKGGLFRLLPASSTWAKKIDDSIIVTAFSASPNFSSDQTIVAGDITGALFISTDAGETFSQTDILTGVGMISQVKFAPDYAVTGEIYIGTSAGLFVSTDFLMTLSAVTGFPVDWVSALALSPGYRADATLFATTPTQGIYKSTDRGMSWELRETGVELVAQTSFHFRELKVSDHFSNDGTVFLATFEGMFRSTDYGNTWIELETRPPTLIMDVALSPAFAQDGLILVSTYGGGLYISEDAGNNWRVSSKGVASPYLYQVAIRENTGAFPVLLTSHSNHLLVSEDIGHSWVEKEIANVLPGICIASKMAISPDFANDTTAYLGCRRDGIVVTHDSGDSWSLVLDSQQLAEGTITSIALSPDYAMDHILMFSEHRGIFAISNDEGLNWHLAITGLPKPGKWYGGRSIDFSPDFKNDHAIAVATEKGFYGVSGNASSWSSVPDQDSPVAQGVIENIAISPDFVNDKTVLTSVRGEGLFRTDDSGLSWQQTGIDSSGYRYDIQNVVFSPDFANDNLIIGFGHDHLFRSTDRGDSFESFDIPFVRHENNRKQSVLYKGNWIEVESSQVSGASFKASSESGQEVSLLFVGTGVRWIGALANIMGKANVYIDDVLVDVIDQYSAEPVLQHVLFETENLPLTTHEIRLEVRGDKNPESLANWVIIDAFDVIR